MLHGPTESKSPTKGKERERERRRKIERREKEGEKNLFEVVQVFGIRIYIVFDFSKKFRFLHVLSHDFDF